MAAPVIAITGPEKGALGPRLLVALAIRFYGGQVVQLQPSQSPSDFAFDGVVITGGHDINPVLYARKPEVEPCYDPARDELEMTVIDFALTRGLPILGICRGAQLMNVFRGGSLYQDLQDQREKTSHRRTLLPLKTLCIEENTWLAEFMGQSSSRINSLHNQAMNDIGRGFTVSGRDLDGIIQAIEDPDYGFLIGVQWHPEFLLMFKQQRQLFKALVDASRKTPEV